MPADAKPLFRPEALRPKLAGFTLPASAEAARPKLADWAALLGSPGADALKETELLPSFLRDLFEDLLGYTGPAGGSPRYTLKREALVEVDGKFADAALGRFSTAGGPGQVVAVLEGKGPRDPLDRPFAGRKRSAVEQALQYAVNLRIDWFLVTNLRETRLYHKGHDLFTFECFETARLAADPAALARFVFLLGAERVTPEAGPGHLDALLADSRRVGRELTNDYYREYATLRRDTFAALRHHNPGVPPADLLNVTQKVLDRVLFIAFCEDRELLPSESIAHAYQHADPYNPRPVWENFKGLFRAVNQGSERLGIDRYNGGLFADDDRLDALTVPDEVCRGFDRLAAYEYGSHPDDPTAKHVDVEILGHIFEQSIADLEEWQRELTADPDAIPVPAGPSKRKKEGAFYTPAFVTRYIVAETLRPVLAARFEALRQKHLSAVRGRARTVLAAPQEYDPKQLTPAQAEALKRFWRAWLDELETVRIVDPACGSGAFLIEAFDQMLAEYRKAHDFLAELEGPSLFDVSKTILTNNLFGMDLNAEAVEIARLSLWIKTAARGKVLTSLDANVQLGNSIVAEPNPLDAWRQRYRAAFAGGGFDVVIGNPPYVRQEWIAKDKRYLEKHYRAFDGVADLYVYFYELGLNLLKPGGRLGFIVTNKWLKAGYGEPLRRLYGEAAWVEQVVDFGHAKQIFPDADVFPCILIARKPDDGPAPATARACVIPRDLLRIDDLSRQIAAEGAEVPRDRFAAGPWNLEPLGVAKLMEKLRTVGVPLKEFAGVVLLSGIKTGFNDAFLIDTPTKNELVKADPKSEPLFKPYLRGQDVERWQAEWTGLWMLALKSSGNHPWPWAEAGDRAEAVFAATYPAVHTHLNQYRDALIRRQDQGEHWWELRACAYWNQFDRPKVMYQEIQFHPCYMLDRAGMLANNKVLFLPTDDLYLLGVLNSPLMWWHNWRYLPHMKDEALTPAGFKMEALPIAPPTNETRAAVESAVARLIELTAAHQSGTRAVLDWLRVEFGIEKPSQKLYDLPALDADGLTAEVKKARGRSRPLSVADVKRLREEHARSVGPLQARAAEARALERRVADLVNAAYGLTPEEVDLLWATAPPRTPVGPPA
jgi:hypothetical protein